MPLSPKALPNPGFKAKPPGQRLPAPTGWRFGDVTRRSEIGCTLQHKALRTYVVAPSHGQALARLPLEAGMVLERFGALCEMTDLEGDV